MVGGKHSTDRNLTELVGRFHLEARRAAPLSQSANLVRLAPASRAWRAGAMRLAQRKPRDVVRQKSWFIRGVALVLDAVRPEHQKFIAEFGCALSATSRKLDLD